MEKGGGRRDVQSSRSILCSGTNEHQSTLVDKRRQTPLSLTMEYRDSRRSVLLGAGDLNSTAPSNRIPQHLLRNSLPTPPNSFHQRRHRAPRNKSPLLGTIFLIHPGKISLPPAMINNLGRSLGHASSLATSNRYLLHVSSCRS